MTIGRMRVSVDYFIVIFLYNEEKPIRLMQNW